MVHFYGLLTCDEAMHYGRSVEWRRQRSKQKQCGSNICFKNITRVI